MRNTIRLIGVVAALLLLWQYGAPLTGVPDYVLPLPSAIGARFAATWQVQAQHLGYTALATLIGLALALWLSLVLALLIVYVRGLELFFLPLLSALNGIPKIAIAPLLIIWFGLGIESKVVLAFLLALFPLFVQALSGLREIDPDILDLSRLVGGNGWRIFAKVRLVHALPAIADGLKVAFPLALAGAIVGEFIGGNTGIGYLILTAQYNLDVALVFAALLSITLFTTAGVGLIGLFEALFLGWRLSKQQS